MSESVEPSLPSSPEPSTEPSILGAEPGKEEFFEACCRMDPPPRTTTTMTDCEDNESEASFHSLEDNDDLLQQQSDGLVDSEAAFTAPTDRHEDSEAASTGRVDDKHSAAGEAIKSHVTGSMSCEDQETHEAELQHPRLVAEETVQKESQEDNSRVYHRNKEEEVAEGTVDNRSNILDAGKDSDDESGGRRNNDTTKIDGDDRSSEPLKSLVNEPDCNSGNLNEEGLVVEDNQLTPEEIDILDLTSVKAMDEECELKVKDRDTDLSQEELDVHTATAVSEKREGNLLFASGLLTDAITRYNAGLRLCPLVAAQDRAMLYHNRAVAYDKMEERKLAVHSLSRALELDPRYCKALARRAGLHEALDSLDDALADYKALLELDPGHRLARTALQRLPPMIEARNEKLKEEMMGKLKDLGNMFLRPFGLSTQNFQMQQDPNSGGYNINFQQNPAN